MLQIKDICKEYRTGDLVQKALDHVSLNLRDNEFVAILGPSGSGKTTLLNIIGGLDRYDSGDLIINGISTKEYQDRDWDSYRNHTIGFIFQSYNLIPHQNILSNVELALTIGGISKEERKEKAIRALEEVGLGDQLHKKPNQMSGGQMQRVAIARALVNDPDILLADEPTGALDSETSIQVMDLLKEVAKDKLVVMVTHNPELAEEYATRIVNLKDGVIQGDTNPFFPQVDEEPIHKNMGKASMSFKTALQLSFNNLRTKLTRTILVAIAGSIGITGIASILSLSNGVDKYIKNVEEETLSEYPLTIQTSAFSLASMLVDEDESEGNGIVQERKTLTSMFSRVTSNDLKSLKTFLDSDESKMNTYAKAIEYSYGLSPQIYQWNGTDYRQVNPDQTFQNMGITFSSAAISTSMSNADLFQQLPTDSSLYINQYDLKAGHWPEKYNEMVLVLSQTGKVTDLALYAMGLKDSAELEEMIKKFSSGQAVEGDGKITSYDYDDFIGVNFRLVNGYQYYTYDGEYKVWTDKSKDKNYMKNLVAGGEQLTIVGVVQPKEDADVFMLTPGIDYPAELTEHIIHNAENSEIVKQQINNRGTDVINNTPFGQENQNAMDMSSLFEIDEGAMSNAFKFDTSGLNTSGLDFNNLDLSASTDPSIYSTSEIDFATLIQGIKFNVTSEQMETIFKELMDGYSAYAEKDQTTSWSHLQEAFRAYMDAEGNQLIADKISAYLDSIGATLISTADLEAFVTDLTAQYIIWADENGYTEVSEGMPIFIQSGQGQALLAQYANQFAQKLADITIPQEVLDDIGKSLYDGYVAYAQANNQPDISKLQESFRQYLQSEEGSTIINNAAKTIIDSSNLEEMARSMVSGYDETIKSMMTNMVTQIGSAITSQLSQLAGGLENAFSFDSSAFANAIHVKMTQEDLQDLMTSMMTQERASYAGNLSKFGYADLEDPYMISIYPKDFESKATIKEILNDYNKKMEKIDKDKVINYTDVVGVLMSSVTDIINAISYVLIAFVAISLVVSSIMIGVITYISVLERQKEIGILRAIGASKRNISEVFNAETFIIGTLAGIFGIITTELLLIPGNALIYKLTENSSIKAALPISAAIILILLSIVLTLIGGLIPSRKAAASDPVTALRTE